MDVHGKPGDTIVVDTMDLGTKPRRGEIVEVLGDPDTVRYHVRWEDGHESVFFPGSTAHVIHPVTS